MNVLKIKSRKPQQNNEIYKKEPKENVRTENYNNWIFFKKPHYWAPYQNGNDRGMHLWTKDRN